MHLFDRRPFRTPTLPPATSTNSYALGDREVLLVEPATPHEDEQRAFLEWARSLVRSGARLAGIFVTHHHVDHVGGLEVFSRELAAPLWMHPLTAEELGRPVGTYRAVSEGDAIELESSTGMPTRYLVLHTPGHARGHVCLFEPRNGVLVAGDMVASEGTILIEPEGGDMQQYLDSLARLAALGPRVALPAHGEPIEDAVGKLVGTREHRLAREGKIAGMLTADPRSLDALLPLAYGDVAAALFPIARLSLEAHLVKLVREGVALHSERGYARVRS